MSAGSKLTVYIGYDPREDLAYHVAKKSLEAKASIPLWTIPLELKALGHTLNRPIERRDGKMWCPISQAPMSTEFAISRFVVPLIKASGWALFVDCDVLFRTDIAELGKIADPRFAVQVVKHDYAPKEGEKMDGQAQTQYSRKNWSSVILWNCEHPSNIQLTRHMLNTLPGRDLHRLCWLRDEEIGGLPREWNHLVGEYPENPDAKIVHFTRGTPNLPGYEGCEFADEWRAVAATISQKGVKHGESPVGAGAVARG